MKSDQERWDRRYEREPSSVPAPDDFLVDHAHLLTAGRGLDVACGRGGNALFLAEQGYRVDAVDVSFNAVATLKVEAVKRSLDVRCFVADLDYYPLPTAYYDLVIVFYFFDPKLVPAIISSLRPGGLVVYATYNYRHTSVKPEFNPAYLVPPRGLVPYFPGFETLIHEEEAGANANVSRFIGRRPPALTL